MEQRFPSWVTVGAKVWISGGNYGASTHYAEAEITRITKASVFAKTANGKTEKRFNEIVSPYGGNEKKIREYGKQDGWSTYYAYLHAWDSDEVKRNKRAGDVDHAHGMAVQACRAMQTHQSQTNESTLDRAKKARAALDAYIKMVEADAAQN